MKTSKRWNDYNINIKTWQEPRRGDILFIVEMMNASSINWISPIILRFFNFTPWGLLFYCVFNSKIISPLRGLGLSNHWITGIFSCYNHFIPSGFSVKTSKRWYDCSIDVKLLLEPRRGDISFIVEKMIASSKNLISPITLRFFNFTPSGFAFLSRL